MRTRSLSWTVAGSSSWAITPSSWRSAASITSSIRASSQRLSVRTWPVPRSFRYSNRRDSRLPAPYPPLDRRVHLARGLTLFDHLPFVETFAASRDTELDLGAAPFRVHPERDERVALLSDRADEEADLVLVQKELARAEGVVVVVRRVRPRRDVHVA